MTDTPSSVSVVEKVDRSQTLRNNTQQHATTTQLLRKKRVAWYGTWRRSTIAPKMYCCSVGVIVALYHGCILVLSKNRNREDRVLDTGPWMRTPEGTTFRGKVQPKNSPNCKYDVALISGSWKLLRNRLLASWCNNNEFILYDVKNYADLRGCYPPWSAQFFTSYSASFNNF